MSDMERGDILLYRGSWSNPIDLAIMGHTKSPVVHAAVVVLDTGTANAPLCVAAQSTGIVHADAGDWAYCLRAHTLAASAERLLDAADWIERQVGQPYGWADIANQALMAAGRNPVLLDMSYDCSDLACSFLWIAGVALPPEMIQHNRVTPGDLLRWGQGVKIVEARIT